MELSLFQWIQAGVGAIIIGLSKGGIPTISTVCVGWYAFIFGSKASVGIMLQVLILANTVAAFIYFREVAWRSIRKLLPPAILGLILGYFFVRGMDQESLKRAIGISLVFFTAAHGIKQYLEKKYGTALWGNMADSGYFTLVLGLATGLATFVSNAAGPIAMIYMLSQNFKKYQLISTMVWYFFILNLIKIPLQISLGTIDGLSFQRGMILGGIAMITTLIAPRIVRYIPQSLFNKIIWSLVLLTGLQLAI